MYLNSWFLPCCHWKSLAFINNSVTCCFQVQIALPSEIKTIIISIIEKLFLSWHWESHILVELWWSLNELIYTELICEVSGFTESHIRPQSWTTLPSPSHSLTSSVKHLILYSYLYLNFSCSHLTMMSLFLSPLAWTLIWAVKRPSQMQHCLIDRVLCF